MHFQYIHIMNIFCTIFLNINIIVNYINNIYIVIIDLNRNIFVNLSKVFLTLCFCLCEILQLHNLKNFQYKQNHHKIQKNNAQHITEH